MTILSLLFWSVGQTSILGLIFAVFMVGVIGAVNTKRSTLNSGVRYCIGAVGFLFGMLWLAAMWEYLQHTGSRPYFEDGFFFDAIFAPVVIGIIVLLPTACLLGAVAALTVAWCKAIVQLFREVA